MSEPARIESADAAPSQMLPGMDVVSPNFGPSSQVETEARRHIAKLIELGVFHDEHRLIGQLVIDLAHTFGLSARAGKAAAAALAARQLMDAMELLPDTPTPAELTEFEQVAALINGGAS